MLLSKPMCKPFLVLSVILCCSTVFPQGSKQQALEKRRQELRKEIHRIDALQNRDKSRITSQVSLIEEDNYKINILDRLIHVTDRQTELLTQNILTNKKKIAHLEHTLQALKSDYAAMVVNTYKARSRQSRMMFLLSSKTFKQAYKRLQYMKQYANYRKRQGDTISLKTSKLQQANATLLKQQKAKEALAAERKRNLEALEGTRKSHEVLLASIKRNLTSYRAQLKAKQRESDRIRKEIDRIIRAKIAASNKTLGRHVNTSIFALTAEEKVLAASFVANKGHLPWPVKKGYVKVRYGLQPYPFNKSLTIKSNGVRIETEKGADIRAVFNGEVSAVVRLKNLNPIVIIRHGNYLTLYKNLSQVYVTEGEKVTTKQSIGTVFTNPYNGESVLSFSISKGTKTEDPALWIYKM